MASVFEKLKYYFFGPEIYAQFDSRFDHSPNTLERYGQKSIKLIWFIISLGQYVSPVAAVVLYRRGFFVMDNMYMLTRWAKYGLITTAAFYAVRTLGRWTSPDYNHFINNLAVAKRDYSNDAVKKKLLKYDFDFSSWPVEFEDKRPLSGSGRGFLSSVALIPCRLFRYTVGSVAIKMVYPGSSTILQNIALWNPMLEGRRTLTEKYNGERFKLLSRDQNEIDVMFVDRRNTSHMHGKTLVICCEGNCGFYELGIMMTPVEAHYSVLGWNHPGFGGSTGTPFPSQEQNAVECVMEFAVQKLGFLPENILLYGWSIGGYTSSWAAKMYPSIKGLIIDASFDDILPLALAQMPPAIHNLVKYIIRGQINLTNAKNVQQYSGPVLFVRRTQDEMISTNQTIATNRGNDLVREVLKHRFPVLMDEARIKLLSEFLNEGPLNQTMMRDKFHVDGNQSTALLNSYVEEYGADYPINIGQQLSEQVKNSLMLFLVTKHLTDYNSTHCTPLPVNLFTQPWSPRASQVAALHPHKL